MHINVIKMLRVSMLQLILAMIGSCQNQDIFYQNDRTSDNNNNNNIAETSKKLEDTVVHDMLKIVDHKFDTLTTRITALERAVSGLQFFSIRQFQRLSGSVQKTQDGMITIGKKVSQLETDGRGLKIAMSLLNRDVSELKSTTTDVLAELESSVIYINDNVDKQAQVLKNTMEDEANKIVMATDELLVRQTEEDMTRSLEKETKKTNKVVNCSTDFSSLHERFDVRLQDFKQELVSNYFNPMIEMQLEFQQLSSVLNENSSKALGSVVKNKIMHDSRDKSTEELIDSNMKQPLERAPDSIVYNDGSNNNNNDNEVTRNSSKSNIARDEEYYENKSRYEEHDDKLVNLLINMTNNVMQATSYFRQNGGLIEEILSNTYDLNRGQDELKKQLQHVLGMGTLTDRSRDQPRADNDVQNHPPTRMLSNGRYFNKPVRNLYRREPLDIRSARDGPVNCGLPSTVLEGLATVIKNGSQLLEILTDLAQMSSTTLAKATSSLQDEVGNMEDVRKRMVSTLSGQQNVASTSKTDMPLERFYNSTQRLQKVAESNGGWLRLIYRNNQHIEKMANQSLFISKRNYQLLLKNHKHRLSLFDIAAKAKAKENENNQVIRPEEEDENDVTLSVSGLKSDLVLDKESLETIYSTSLQLNRIMPALTKLLAEPDPLITLVDGGGDDQGRLEIYNNGQWGTICHKELIHKEADVVCRHLGFQGGFSAGAGHFGSGTGVAWSLNVTCLGSETLCTPVKLLPDMSLCDHEKDVGIICDHMLRIASGNDTSASNKTGRLEIMHQGLWLPVCGEGWSGFPARVACKQMGFVDGREVVQEPWLDGANSTWLNKVACDGNEAYLDACTFGGWSDSCKDFVPAGVRCL